MSLPMLARVVLLIVLSSAGGTLAFAQLQSGRILGTVYDPQHAGIPGATVTVTNTATNFARAVVTDPQGNYVVTPLDPGTYRVTAEISGFQKTVREGLELTVGQAARVSGIRSRRAGQLASGSGAAWAAAVAGESQLSG